LAHSARFWSAWRLRGSHQSIIDYLRESAATYIYSNSISPGCAAAAMRLRWFSFCEGHKCEYFGKKFNLSKKELKQQGFEFCS
jgi:glycine C-acetyltransferase